MTHKSDGQHATALKLDPAKLLGFRNLTPVTGPESDLKHSAELAFTKKGTEAAAA